jgi:hypothetical protein
MRRFSSLLGHGSPSLPFATSQNTPSPCFAHPLFPPQANELHLPSSQTSIVFGSAHAMSPDVLHVPPAFGLQANKTQAKRTTNRARTCAEYLPICSPRMEIINVEFAAMVPRGHEVVVAKFRSTVENKFVDIVIDTTANVVYCDDRGWGPLIQIPQAIDDPISAFQRWSWALIEQTKGTVSGAIVSTRDDGDSNHARTRIFIEPSTSAGPFR